MTPISKAVAKSVALAKARQVKTALSVSKANGLKELAKPQGTFAPKKLSKASGAFVPQALSVSREPLFLSDKSSKALAAALKRPESKPEFQLAFSSKRGFVSPDKRPLQVAYLTRGSKSGYSISYLDYAGGKFYAQPPGVSGQVRGPFELPKGFKPTEARARALPKVSGNDDGGTSLLPRSAGSGGSGIPGLSIMESHFDWRR